MKLFIKRKSIDKKIKELEIQLKEVSKSVNRKNTMHEKAQVFVKEERLEFAIEKLKELL